MRIVAYIPTKNEQDRYLEPCLSSLVQTVDEVFVYDDQSEDDTVKIARGLGCTVQVRPNIVPSFMQHEGRFRQAAWDAMTDQCHLKDGDWVVAIDADEFLMHETEEASYWLRFACQVASGASAILIQKWEIFGFDDDGCPLVRTDGFWGNIIGTRLCRFQTGGEFNDLPMGCGSEPTYASKRSVRNTHGLYLLHYGYATKEDQVAKHQRYSSLVDHGHSDKHIQSIIQPPKLERFKYQYVPGLNHG